MPDIVLVADTSRPTGSANSRRLRHHGRIPAVVYGHGIASTPVSVEARALRSALSTSAGQNVVFELDVDGTHHLAMAKVVDHHPVRHTISHVDFLVVNRDVKVTADVRIALVGVAEAVNREGGVVDQMLHTITVSMLPSDIPDQLEADISNLEVGGVVRVSDLVLPRGVTTEVDLETPVVMAAHAVVLEEPVAAEAAASEEGTEAGDAAASGEASESGDAEGS
ncbi:MAG: 50S ribosomal protein L25 [Acidimicrobiales bacterium]